MGFKGTVWTKVTAEKKDLTGKTAIVTGANVGIGYEVAKSFAAMGARVIMACRSIPSEPSPQGAVDQIIAATGNSKVEWRPIDYGDFETVHAFAEGFLKEDVPLDLLINNAGGQFPMFIKSKDGMEMTYQVNYLSHVLITTLLMPALAKAKDPRIVNVASNMHYSGVLDFNNLNGEKETEFSFAHGSSLQFYSNTKLLLMLYTVELQQRLRADERTRHVIVNAVHPGWVKSDIWSKMYYNNPALALWIVQRITNLVGIECDEGAVAHINAAISDDAAKPTDPNKKWVPTDGGPGGKYYNRIWEEKPRPEVWDRRYRNQLWERTMRDIGMSLSTVKRHAWVGEKFIEAKL